MTSPASHSATIQQTSPPPVFYRVSTREVPADIRFDYWQSQFPASRIDRPRARDIGDFMSDMLGSALLDDAVFGDLCGDPVTCHFGEHESGTVLLGYIGAGVVDIRHGSNQTTAVNRHSGLVLFDCDRPFVTSSQQYAMTYLILPRSLITAALGSDPVPLGNAVRELPAGKLATSFSRHLHAMAKYGERLPATEAAHTLRTAQALAVATLAKLRANWRSLPETFDGALLAAARHLLKQHLDDTQLTAEQLAAALGCSRAHLYRLFAEQGQTIAGQLRELRLQQARMLLEMQHGEMQHGELIGMIAFRCGYTDQSAFGKVFRQHFGLTPSECRERARRKGSSSS